MELGFNIYAYDSDDSDLYFDAYLKVNIATFRNIDAVKTIVSALHENNTLLKADIHINGVGADDNEVSSYMKTHHEELTRDPRVCYKKFET